MAVSTSPIANSGGVVNMATGTYTGTGSGNVTIGGVGFTPRKIKIIDVTDGTKTWDWIAGMGEAMIYVAATAGPVTVASAIVTDYGQTSTTEPGDYGNDVSGAGDGTLINQTENVEDDVNPRTYEVVLNDTNLNLSAKVYAYSIEG